jgi:hypothetical protein
MIFFTSRSDSRSPGATASCAVAAGGSNESSMSQHPAAALVRESTMALIS